MFGAPPAYAANDGATKSSSRTFCSPLLLLSDNTDNNCAHLTYSLCRHLGPAALLLDLSMAPVSPFDPTFPSRMISYDRHHS
jgi:hypothetical protein